MAQFPILLSPLVIRGVRTRNRIVISPMCQYSAIDGHVNDWHLVNLGRFALGGAGVVFVEATAIDASGRITPGDAGLWRDDQVPELRRIAHFLKAHGSVPAIQLSHAGRKGSAQRPWHGGGPLGEQDLSERGDAPWTTVAPSALAVGAGWHVPDALDQAAMDDLKANWVAATRRALDAGFEIIELHCAHGYLLHQFLSPISNHRADDYGQTLEGRCRFPLEVASAMRAVWPADKPMFVRVSAVDAIEGGWSLEDTVFFSGKLKAIGIDVIDCSSGGIGGSATAGSGLQQGLGFQVPFAQAVREQVAIATMAVGLILDAAQAESVLHDKHADLIAVGREALYDPNWAHHAERQLSGAADFKDWPEQSGWWLANRDRTLRKLGNACE